METERAVERAAAEAELLDGLGRLGRWKARLVLRLAARHIPLREVGKVPFLQAIDVGRCAARVLGDLLHRSGAIDDPNDVVFLTFDELVEGCPANARELIAERQELHRRYSEMDLPQSWVGPPTPIYQQPHDAATTELKGLPVFPGVVEGRAVVVHDPRGATGFEDGDILVCEFTDPSWVMLMNLAGALVIDIGGAMSHGAIIARELGIPTVISTGEGTRVLQTGDRLRVDAGAGTVELIERPDRAAMEESR
jgi:pyruvate,water dikinase